MFETLGHYKFCSIIANKNTRVTNYENLEDYLWDLPRGLRCPLGMNYLNMKYCYA